MNILILAAGPEQVTENEGYPLCLVEIDSMPLIQKLIESCLSLKPEKIIVAFRKDDVDKYYLENIIKILWSETKILQIKAPTEGASCTALLAAKDIDNDDELLIINGNELLQANYVEIIDNFHRRKLDAGVVIFPSVHPRYSYVRLDEQKFVVEASEKNPISNHATAGFYWFSQGCSFIRAAKNAIRKDARIDGKFFICPTFNELVLEQLSVGVFEIDSRLYKPLKSERQIQNFNSTFEKVYRT